MSLTTYIGSLTVTQGAGAGVALRVLPWQRRFISRAWAVDGDRALSIARGNGKSTLVAAVACAAVDGPLRRPRAEVVCAASSFMQGRIIFEHVCAFLRERGHDLTDRKRWRVQDSQNVAIVENRTTGSRVRCIGSDPKRAHGLAPLLVLADEPAQWEPTKSEAMRAALVTAMGKIEGSRMIALGTRPADEAHWFAKMLDGGADIAQCHAAGEDDPPFQRRTWIKANPSLPIMPALEARIRREAADAKRDESLIAAFKALRLNMGTDDTVQSTLLDAGTWERIESPDGGERPGDFVLGVDFGTSAAMSAVAAYWPESGALDALACFPEVSSLSERGLQDGVGRAYWDMHSAGDLMVAGHRVSDVHALMSAALDRWGRPAAIVCDRWREAELRQVLDALRFPLAALVVRGMGYQDGGADVREFRAACLRGRVTPRRSLLMRSAMSEARVVMDPAGNAKLSKSCQGGRRMRAREDAAAAAILAVAAGHRRGASAPKPRRRYYGLAG